MFPVCRFCSNSQNTKMSDARRQTACIAIAELQVTSLLDSLKYIGTPSFLSVRRLANVFMIPFPQFTVLPTAHAKFYGQLMVYLSSFRGLVGRLSGYVRSCITLTGMCCKAA